MSEPSDKDALIARLRGEVEVLKAELKVQKDKVDALLARLFGTKSEQLDPGQLELLLSQGSDLGKAAASVADGPTEAKPAAKKNPKRSVRRRERWPADLPTEDWLLSVAALKVSPKSKTRVATKEDVFSIAILADDLAFVYSEAATRSGTMR